jgi:hypothetical protein
MKHEFKRAFRRLIVLAMFAVMVQTTKGPCGKTPSIQDKRKKAKGKSSALYGTRTITFCLLPSCRGQKLLIYLTLM